VLSLVLFFHAFWDFDNFFIEVIRSTKGERRNRHNAVVRLFDLRDAIVNLLIKPVRTY
jgi:hypothetical protein